jgi:hypothetical protein
MLPNKLSSCGLRMRSPHTPTHPVTATTPTPTFAEVNSMKCCAALSPIVCQMANVRLGRSCDRGHSLQYSVRFLRRCPQTLEVV